jgi:hypothetical protein
MSGEAAAPMVKTSRSASGSRSVNGTLLDPNILGKLGAGDPSGCSRPFVHIGSGAGEGFKSDVVYAVDGTRVAVLLLNGVRPGETGYARAAAAANSLYCAA